MRKGIEPVPTLRELPADELACLIGYRPRSSDGPLSGRVLIAPVLIEGKLSSLEFIDEVGRKTALAGGAISGGFWLAQEIPHGNGEGLTLLLAEGIATAISAQAATEHPSFAALSSSNLLKAAQALRKRHPKATIIVLADLGNGEHHAHDAARAVDGLVATPAFGRTAPSGAKDFNDMLMLVGPEAMARAVADARAPALDRSQPGQNQHAEGGSAPATEPPKANAEIAAPAWSSTAAIQCSNATQDAEFGEPAATGQVLPGHDTAVAGNPVIESVTNGPAVEDRRRRALTMLMERPNLQYAVIVGDDADSRRAILLMLSLSTRCQRRILPIVSTHITPGRSANCGVCQAAHFYVITQPQTCSVLRDNSHTILPRAQSSSSQISLRRQNHGFHGGS